MTMEWMLILINLHLEPLQSDLHPVVFEGSYVSMTQCFEARAEHIEPVQQRELGKQGVCVLYDTSKSNIVVDHK